MQRQSTAQQVAQSLGITEDSVNDSVSKGLFLTTFDSSEQCHYLDVQECVWAWKEYVSKVAQGVAINDKTKSDAIEYVRGKRVWIIEEGRYFDYVPNNSLPDNGRQVAVTLFEVIAGVLLACAIVYVFIFK